MPDTVTPLTVAVDPPFTVTASVLAGWSGSLTVAICETDGGAPWVRVNGDAGVMAGGELTVSWKVAVEIAPQLSVAVTVTV
jgi:hypothetical protein